MPDKRRASCQNCGESRAKVGPISWGGYCGECGPKLMVENIDGLHTKSGVPWQRYRLGAIRGLLGEPIANALFRAGAFAEPVDGSPEGS